MKTATMILCRPFITARISVSGRAQRRPADSLRQRAISLPTRIGDIPGDKLAAATLLDHIGQDKKVERGRLTFILTRGIGKAFIAKDIPPADVAAFLEEKVG